MVARRYEFYFRVVKTIFYQQAQRVKYCFLPRENKIHIFKPPRNFLFIIWTRVFLYTVSKLEMTSSISSLVRI